MEKDALKSSPYPSTKLNLPSSKSKIPLSQGLLLNLTDMLWAYVFACRFLNGDLDEDPLETQRVLWASSKLLSETKPFVYQSIGELVSLVQSRAYLVSRIRVPNCF
jgi:hypothetical protein